MRTTTHLHPFVSVSPQATSQKAPSRVAPLGLQTKHSQARQRPPKMKRQSQQTNRQQQRQHTDNASHSHDATLQHSACKLKNMCFYVGACATRSSSSFHQLLSRDFTEPKKNEPISGSQAGLGNRDEERHRRHKVPSGCLQTGCEQPVRTRDPRPKPILVWACSSPFWLSSTMRSFWVPQFSSSLSSVSCSSFFSSWGPRPK